MGPSISTVYAKYVEDCCRKRILTSELVKLKELFQRPENCPALSVPTINPDLWAQLPKDQKEHDKRLQSAQGLLAKGLTGVIEVKETLLQFNTNPDKFPTLFKELTEKLDACVAILGNAHLETSFRRRDMLKSALNPRFHSLCSTKTRLRITFSGTISLKQPRKFHQLKNDKVNRSLTLLFRVDFMFALPKLKPSIHPPSPTFHQSFKLPRRNDQFMEIPTTEPTHGTNSTIYTFSKEESPEVT